MVNLELFRLFWGSYKILAWQLGEKISIENMVVIPVDAHTCTEIGWHGRSFSTLTGSGVPLYEVKFIANRLR